MKATYKIPYEIFSEYFYDFDLKQIKSIININKFFNYIFKIPVFVLILFFIICMATSLFIVRFVAASLSVLIIEILMKRSLGAGYILSQTLKFQSEDIYSIFLVILIFVITLSFSRITFKF